MIDPQDAVFDSEDHPPVLNAQSELGTPLQSRDIRHAIQRARRQLSDLGADEMSLV